MAVTLNQNLKRALARLFYSGAGEALESSIQQAQTDYHTAASQAAMLALTAVQGDFAFRTDTKRLYILNGSDATVLGNWVEMIAAGLYKKIITVGTVGLTGVDFNLAATNGVTSDLTLTAALVGSTANPLQLVSASIQCTETVAFSAGTITTLTGSLGDGGAKDELVVAGTVKTANDITAVMGTSLPATGYVPVVASTNYTFEVINGGTGKWIDATAGKWKIVLSYRDLG